MQYLEDLGDGDLDAAYARVRSYEDELSRYALGRLTAIDGLTLHGIADPDRIGERTPTFCFTLAGESPRQTNERLARAGVFAWDGNYYALELMRALGIGGAVRAGFLHYNTHAEADRLAEVLAAR
jgi:selenocysteine lyase/cysteine desulfurase